MCLQPKPLPAPTNPSTQNVQLLNPLCDILDPKRTRCDVSSIAQHVEENNRGYTNESPRLSDHSFPGQRHSLVSLPHMPSEIPPVTGFQSTNQMIGSYDNAHTLRQHSVPPLQICHKEFGICL